ncbi:unnamed protein product [Musa textilis]
MAQKVPVIGLALALATRPRPPPAAPSSPASSSRSQRASARCSTAAPPRSRSPSIRPAPWPCLELARSKHYLSASAIVSSPSTSTDMYIPNSRVSSLHGLNDGCGSCGRWIGKISDDSGNTVNARQSRAGDPIHTSSSKSRFYCFYYVGFSRVKSRAVEVIYICQLLLFIQAMFDQMLH